MVPNNNATLTIGSICAWSATAGASVGISNVSVRVSPIESVVSPSSGSFHTADCKSGLSIPKSPVVANVVVSVPDPEPTEFRIGVVPAALILPPITAVPLAALSIVTTNVLAAVH